MYQVTLEKFEGPLDLLLQLIENNKLDICEISLSQITNAYLGELGKISHNSNELAEFIVIATKLLYIKSKELLPSMINKEDEQEIADLEAALAEYQKYKKAARQFENILAKDKRSFSKRIKKREVISFSPPKDLDKQNLWQIFTDVLSQAEDKYEEKKVSTAQISLEDKKKEVLNQVRNGQVNFKSLLKKSRTKTEMILTFLAILDMIKQREIIAKQTKNFADFTIRGVK
jgi:segregation and condensation protein A